MKRQFVPQKQKTATAHKIAVEPASCASDLRRGTRFPIRQRCMVFPINLSLTVGELAPEGWHCIAYNISATGIGVALPLNLRQGTELSIQGWGLEGVEALSARIIHTKPVDFLWFAGCEFRRRLSNAELELWKSGSPRGLVEQQ